MAENRGPQVSGVSALFLALTWIFISMRIYCRLVIVKCFGLDDYLAVIAQVSILLILAKNSSVDVSQILFTFFTAFAITGVQYGTGQHAQDIQPPSNIPIGLKVISNSQVPRVLAEQFVVVVGMRTSLCPVQSRHQDEHLCLPAKDCRLKNSTGHPLHRYGRLRSNVHLLLFLVCFPMLARCLLLGAIHWGARQMHRPKDYHCLYLRILRCNMWGRLDLLHPTRIHGLAPSDESKNEDLRVCYSCSFCHVSTSESGFLPLCYSFTVFWRTYGLTTKSASAATIIRFPYVPDLSNTADFLYATTDVAIWSITETGLAITASAAATLRPLFRTFLSRSRLMGGSTKEGSGGWPSSRAGYLRSGGMSGRRKDEEIGLRSDVGKNVGVTTVIDGKSMKHSIESGKSSEVGVIITEGTKDWNESQSKLTEGNSEEFGSNSAWARGIKKTTVVSTHRT
jgi:hypothetical protein